MTTSRWTGVFRLELGRDQSPVTGNALLLIMRCQRRPEDSGWRHLASSCLRSLRDDPLSESVGALPEWEDKILLCRRAIEPQYGFWTVPAGFMENRETTAEAAARETEEEARARIEVGALFSLVNIAHISQVHLFYRARLIDLDFGPGTESLEVRLFSEDEIPWEDIAFRSIHFTLKRYFDDRQSGTYGFHTADLAPLQQ